MKVKNLFAKALIVSVVPMVSFANDSQTNKAIAIQALTKSLGEGNVEAVDTYFDPSYIQHNPDVPNGTDGLKELIGMLHGNDDSNFKSDFVRIIADDDIVAFHGRYEGFGPKPMIAFDVFRLENGKIVEHWDNLTEESEPNPSGRTQIDGSTEITDLDKTEENKAKVLAFLTKSMIEQAEINITDYISPVTYIQHNSMVADGLEGFGAFMTEMAQQGISMDYTKVHRVIGEGNFVLSMSEGTFGKDAMAFYDLFRLEDGLIEEHWDVIAPLPGSDAKHNEAGKF